MSTSTVQNTPVIPDDIARAAVLPESYGNMTAVNDAYRWIRQNMPLGQARIEGYDPIWLVTKHADIMAIGRQPDVFHNGELNHILQDQANDEFQKNVLGNGSIRILDSLTYMDQPEHTKLKAITKDWFQLANVRQFEDQIREHAKEAVDRFMESDGEIDFASEVALRYPLRVIMTLFGVPLEHEPRMAALTQELFAPSDPEVQREDLHSDPLASAKQFQAAVQGFFEFFQDLAEERRRHPTDDLMSLIANAELDGAPLSENYQNGYYTLVATAGHDTTSYSIAGGMHGLLQFPDQFEKVRADDRLIPGLVDESIRWATPVRHFMRNTVAPTTLRDQQIGEMERLMLLYFSANRDEEVFNDPDVFDITRRPNKQIAFGFGPHSCIGLHVAKLEMQLFWRELLPRLKSIEPAGEPRYLQTNFIGGLKSLPIRFTKS